MERSHQRLRSRAVEDIYTEVAVEGGDRRLPENDVVPNVFGSSVMTADRRHQVVETPLHRREVPNQRISGSQRYCAIQIYTFTPTS